MTNIYAKAALLEQGWAEDVRLVVQEGQISEINIGAAPQQGDICYKFVLPGLDNVHSHAFQRAMSGLAEQRGSTQDSFWSWRNVMYEQALMLDPDDVEAVAAQLYAEMLEAGFTRVGEFHYLHHDRQGKPYAVLSEMAQHIAAAAQIAGISLTLLPVFYAHSGFGGATPNNEQRRFIHSLDSFFRLWQECTDLVASLPSARLGLAIHSLRAATMQELQQLLPLAANMPIHIHIAEQVKEVEDCINWSGARPVEWLLDNAPVGENWTLIHATHINEAEIAALARSGAIAGLCPITEANLGDGIFPAVAFLEQGGHFAIGSDSNILISVAQELRQLEYSQRLVELSRNVIADSGQSTGLRLYRQALYGGAKSIFGNGAIGVGKQADFITLEAESWADFTHDTLIDQWVFGQGVKIDCVFVGGKKRVAKGRHLDHLPIKEHFTRTMRKLRT